MIDRLTEIEERCKRASPGPWTFRWNLVWRPVVEAYESLELVSNPFVSSTCVCYEHVTKTRLTEKVIAMRDEGEFVAHSREDVPWLVAEVKRLKKKAGETS